MAEDDRSCHLALKLLDNGIFDLDAWGHTIPWERDKATKLRDLLIQILDATPDGTNSQGDPTHPIILQIAIPTQIIIHLRPDEARELVNTIGADLAYLGAQDLRQAQEG